MNITILTLVPELYDNFKKHSIIGKAIEKKLVNINIVNIRDYSNNKHHKVDDIPYGGGSGMIMTLQPIVDAINAFKKENTHIILTSPIGQVLKQSKVKDIISNYKDIMIICGRYEGIDHRIMNYIDEVISIGDYILTGGELASMVISDSIIRLLDGVIKDDSKYNESFEFGILDYPQYTKPVDYDGYIVDPILRNGNHKLINEYRYKEALKLTYLYRKDLLVDLNEQQLELLNIIKKELNDE